VPALPVPAVQAVLVPLQSMVFAPPHEQIPPEHDEPGSQAWPQPPQFALSLWVSMQTLWPLTTQTVELAPVQLATHAPPWQYGCSVSPPTPQMFPQVPQLLVSVRSLVQA
jgi:hypothetical protein